MTDNFGNIAHFRKPHDKQVEFIDSKAKRKIIRAGRRSGKTVGVADLAGRRFIYDKQRILYAAPTDDQVSRFWHEIVSTFWELIESNILYKNETKHILEVQGTEQRIRAKTAWNADTLRGDYADLLILDEWQLMNEDAWGLVGAPMLLDNDGDAIFIYTPPSIRTRSVTKAYDPQHAAKLFKKAKADTTGRWEAFSFTSHENPHISENALQEITQDMTSLAYQQEIMAEDIEEVPGALWTVEMITKAYIETAPKLRKVVVGVDPQGRNIKSAETGIVVMGLGEDDLHGYVLADKSINARPEGWGRQVVEAYHEWEANYVVAESNYGGEMVESVIKAVDKDVPVKLVHASRGKIVRADPISAKYEKGLIHHVGSFPKLENEMLTYIGDPRWSPNRLDALVWAGTYLMLKYRGHSDGFILVERETEALPF